VVRSQAWDSLTLDCVRYHCIARVDFCGLSSERPIDPVDPSSTRSNPACNRQEKTSPYSASQRTWSEKKELAVYGGDFPSL
jgi:hypothetical protein